ncbi:TRAP-type C4-dicarboxylate transport system substrate-binding protein [Maritimibacter alkaliphilus HTCC2654]|uniref:TRAP family transporter, periplasmic substrate binding subunit n=1 Tax=Maritimibacter alkaliphilus HTCC2654 TaxID=314271 RepID=A3VDL1_9RHOB|nr:TRAP transporter substrate-binding protein [Maritimibacter alkaliphilus]EAQ13600.1 TRAP family transporter, periplasmic substrate binding subunit [Maritimibacter alkaliphilus HTCC2654]TYP83439.1 TRAP-type C4-dicarboxylate transport system substrate-binding protein [Maritimibacter alkaliphilus HTCC2654]
MKYTVICAAALIVGASSAFAQTKLTFASPAPAPTPLHAAVLEGWAQKVTEDSNGTLEVELVTGGTLAAHGQVLDRVTQGVVQIGWDIQGYYPGKFPKTEVVALPFGFDTSENGTVAMNKLLEDGTIASEYQDVKVLNLFTFPNGYLLSSKPTASLADAAGQKISGINPTRQSIAGAVDGVPVSLSITDWYQGLSRGTIDGAIESYSAVAPFRLQEVTGNALEVPLGGNAAFMFMNQDVFDGLPDEAKAAIENNSGAEFDRQMGAFWDGAAGYGRKLMTDAGATITTPDEAQMAEWETALQPIIDAWVESVDGGEDILDKFHEAASADM